MNVVVPSIRRPACALAIALLGAVSVPPLTAQDPEVRYDHYTECPTDGAEGCRHLQELELSPGQKFRVVITSIHADSFSVDIQGAVRAAPEEEVAGNRATPGAPAGSIVLERKHDDRFGGYLVSIRRKAGVSTKVGGEAVLTIVVREPAWEVAFGGGFAVSSLTDRIYAAVQDGDALRVQRREDREDEADLALATMVHLWHTSRPWLAISFGLGLKDSRPSYYFGPSVRFGDHAAISVGAVLGRIKDLPGELREGDAVSDANALTRASTPARAGWFAAISYSFAGGGKDAIAKPFLPPK